MHTWLIGQLRTRRVLLLITLDSLAWFAALYVAAGLRLETWSFSEALHISTVDNTIPLHGILTLAVSAAVLHALLAWALRLHQGRSSTGSFEEIFILASVMLAVGVAVTTLNALASQAYLPRTTPVVATCLALIMAAWPRALWRVVVTEAKPNRFGVITKPVLIVGAGEAARQLIESMQRDPKQKWNPVAMLDDDPRKRHFRFRGVPVAGTTDDISSTTIKLAVRTIVIAIPSASAGAMGRINDLARQSNLVVKVLPSVGEVLNGTSVTAVRNISPEDLLGRHQIETDMAAIADYLHGKRVLVTGAGGSIGSELCRQITTFDPAELMMLDRDESALHALILSIRGRADLESPDVILANIRDADRIMQVFEERRPQVVFHAAALKHVNMLEGHATEALKTNVLGTLYVLEAAMSVGVERFVNVSTDKAADPQNVLGYTKRIAEGLTTTVASSAPGTYLSVRFGNVLGTRGSVLKTFGAQIKAGGPVTVTDPKVSRFFMTVHEAVQLVIQASALGRDGEALVLDMGEPIKILDVANQLIEQSHKKIPIVFTGLKPGEKLHEVLFGTGEIDDRPMHPLVSHVVVPPVTPEDVMSLYSGRDNAKVILTMKEMAERMRLQMLAEVRH